MLRGMDTRHLNIANLAERLKRRNGRPELPSLILMTDEDRLPDPQGAAVCLRHYGVPGRAELARALRQLCRRKGLRLIVAGDAGLAASVGADGLHLPEAVMRAHPLAALLWRRRPGRILTVAAHSPSALFAAQRLGADAALLAPVFPTQSHPDVKPIGPLRFAAWCRAAPLPVYALGGVDVVSCRCIMGTRAAGLAAIGALA